MTGAFLGLAVWALLALALGVQIGKAIARADADAAKPADDLTDDEIRQRCAAIDRIEHWA